MSDSIHTPLVEMIFSEATAQRYGISKIEAEKKFRDWLHSYKVEVIHATEERIIKLLESKLCWCVGQPLNEENGREELMKHMNCDWEAMMIEYHVALIKGENK